MTRSGETLILQVSATRTPTPEPPLPALSTPEPTAMPFLQWTVAVAVRGLSLIDETTLSTPEVLAVAIDVAHEAGALIRAAFGHTGQVGFKGAVNPVTETDVAAERMIHSRLRAAFPDHRIFGEELGEDRAELQRGSATPVWLVDPLDGTNNFAHGFPHFAVSLGLVADGEIRLGWSTTRCVMLRSRRVAVAARRWTVSPSMSLGSHSVRCISGDRLSTIGGLPPTTTRECWTTFSAGHRACGERIRGARHGLPSRGDVSTGTGSHCSAPGMWPGASACRGGRRANLRLWWHAGTVVLGR